MAFALDAISGATTYSLSDGTPFRLEKAEGVGMTPVRRVTEQTAFQDGDSDLGYRLTPRVITLTIGFRADTDALLDGYRNTLSTIFRPFTSTPVILRVTRDDGEVRQIDCHRIGQISIALLPGHRPGHYHRAVVQLKAADPAWYEPTAGTATVTGTALLFSQWWLASGAIGTAQVLMQGGTPAQGEAWSYTGTIPFGTSWTIAFRSAQEGTPASGLVKYAFYVPNNYPSETQVAFGAGEYGYEGEGVNRYPLGSSFMPAGTTNYFVQHMPGTITSITIQGNNSVYRSPGFSNPTPLSPGGSVPLAGTATRRWRSDYNNTASTRWTSEIPLYAAYSPALSESQMNALDAAMSGNAGGSVTQVLAVPYEGDLPEFPVISLTGPLTGARIVNSVTGDTLDFGTVVIGAGTTYVIDTRYGYKTVSQGTINKNGELTADSDLETWHLAPSPVATGGTNIISVDGTNPGTATSISVVYYNRFPSY